MRGAALRLGAAATFAVLCGCSAFEAADCIQTYSGAISGTTSCKEALGTSVQAEVRGCGGYPDASYCSSMIVDPVLSVGQAGADVSAGVTFPGQLANGTYANATPGVGADIQISQGSRVWRAWGPIGGPASRGAWKLTITEIGPVHGTWNALHGALDATLPADTTTPATGTVTLHSTF